LIFANKNQAVAIIASQLLQHRLKTCATKKYLVGSAHPTADSSPAFGSPLS
jgi:hypothetical protein